MLMFKERKQIKVQKTFKLKINLDQKNNKQLSWKFKLYYVFDLNYTGISDCPGYIT